MRKRYRKDIVVDRPVEEAFPLFTPKGEEDWVPGWKPDYFAPESGETRKDMLFACRARDARTTEVTVSYDVQALGEAGERYIAGMTDEAFAGMIGAWSALIGEMDRGRNPAKD